MSLDVYLIEAEEKEVPCRCECCGNIHRSTAREELYSSNITHNLGKMAKEAGIYQALWRPDEPYPHKSKDIIEVVEKGLALMESDPYRFKNFDAANGWGTYDQFVPWIKDYLAALKQFPESDIKVSR